MQNFSQPSLKKKFIRFGSYKKALKDHPEEETMLWRCFDTTPFEKQIAIADVDDAEVLKLLDYPSYFQLLKQSFNRNGEWDAESLQPFLDVQ